jgi:hypothetical protein
MGKKVIRKRNLEGYNADETISGGHRDMRE